MWLLPCLLILIPIVGLAILSALSRQAPVLGVSDGHLKACAKGSQNCVCSQSETNSISPLHYSGQSEEALSELEAIINRWPGATVVERSPVYLRAEFQSRIFRFIDDVEFLAAPDQKILHVRSASRVGRSDLGANRERIEALRRQFEGPAAK